MGKSLNSLDYNDNSYKHIIMHPPKLSDYIYILVNVPSLDGIAMISQAYAIIQCHNTLVCDNGGKREYHRVGN